MRLTCCVRRAWHGDAAAGRMGALLLRQARARPRVTPSAPVEPLLSLCRHHNAAVRCCSVAGHRASERCGGARAFAAAWRGVTSRSRRAWRRGGGRQGLCWRASYLCSSPSGDLDIAQRGILFLYAGRGAALDIPRQRTRLRSFAKLSAAASLKEDKQTRAEGRRRRGVYTAPPLLRRMRAGKAPRTFPVRAASVRRLRRVYLFKTCQRSFYKTRYLVLPTTYELNCCHLCKPAAGRV